LGRQASVPSKLGLLLVAALGCFAAPAHAQRRVGTPDAQIVRDAQLVASSGRVDLFQHGIVAVDAKLAEAAERTLTQMERLLGRKLDEATLGPRVRIYVSPATGVSHVWRGYNHPSDPQAALFPNPRVAEVSLRGTNATYAHELAHLLTWRYHSHTLREGLADWLALELHPGAAVGPNEPYSRPLVVGADIDAYLGTTRPAPDALTSNAGFRQLYYFASFRFVRYLVARGGMATFLQLYDARDPQAEFPHLYGASREALAKAAAK